MIKDKKVIESAIYALDYMLCSEDEYIPFDEITCEYLDIDTIDLDDDSILWGDSEECILKDVVRMNRYILENADPNILKEIYKKGRVQE
tara:strand:- start:25 stop:291 length:267 start_codon:yes stop_codon:yes gene_type:complete